MTGMEGAPDPGGLLGIGAAITAVAWDRERNWARGLQSAKPLDIRTRRIVVRIGGTSRLVKIFGVGGQSGKRDHVIRDKRFIGKNERHRRTEAVAHKTAGGRYGAPNHLYTGRAGVLDERSAREIRAQCGRQ